MNYFLFVRVLHEYQYYIQMNVNIMGELAYFDSRHRTLRWCFWALNLWEVGVRFINHTLPWSYKWQETAKQRNPTTLWHTQQTVYMQLRTCFSNLFKCIRRSLVWSLTWSSSSNQTFQMNAWRTKIFAISGFLSIRKLLDFIKSESLCEKLVINE